MAFEELTKALERENSRLNPAVVLRPMVVNTVDDIKRAIREVDPQNTKPAPEIQLAALLNAIEDGNSNTYRVTTATRSKSKREMLLEGMDLIKRQIEASDKAAARIEPIEVNGVMMKAPRFGGNGNGKTWVDPLIRHWLGAYRDGLTICWDIGGSQYRYDIFSHTLKRVTK